MIFNIFLKDPVADLKIKCHITDPSVYMHLVYTAKSETKMQIPNITLQ